MEWMEELPEPLTPFREKLLESKRHFIEIVPTLEPPSLPWQSCFGGTPYLPKGSDFPTSPDGTQLFFLAQINLAETPRLEPFPQQGILQFFIFDDAYFGMDMEDPFRQDRFRVIYYPEVIEDKTMLQSDFSFLRTYDDLPVYTHLNSGMGFMLEEEVVPLTDQHFNRHLGQDFFKQFGDLEWPLYNFYGEQTSSEGHKLGGYAHFAQEDPRKDDQLLLLFQMDTDAEMESMWGDMGTAKFFISKENLSQKDFSRVMFYWDAY